MIIGDLIRLRKGVMVGHTSSVISVTSEVRFWSLLLFDFDSHNFDLVVRQSDLNFELRRHHMLISFDRVVVVRLSFRLVLLMAHILVLVHVGCHLFLCVHLQGDN